MPRVPGSVPAHSKPVYDAFLAAGSWSAGLILAPGRQSRWAGGCAAIGTPGRS